MAAMSSPAQPTPVRVLAVLADGPLLVALRTALCEPTDGKSALSFVAETADPATAIARAQQLRPDLALIDIPIGGLEAAQGIRRQSPQTRIVFLTGAVIGPDQATSGLAYAYIYRDIPPAAIASAISNLLRAVPDPKPEPGPASLDERLPPLDLPLRDPLPPARPEPSLEDRPEVPQVPAQSPPSARRPAGSHVARLRQTSLLLGQAALVQAALVAAVGLTLLIAALLGAGGAALAATGFALAMLAAGATLNQDPLVRRFLPPLAAALFAIVGLTWGATADRSFAADGLVPALIVLAGLGALWYRGERTSRPVAAQATPPSTPPTMPEVDLSDAGASAP